MHTESRKETEMKFAEINRKFTEIVAGYIAAGFTFNTATMCGNQGEFAKVDLTNGKMIARVSIERMSGYEVLDGDVYLDKKGVSLMVFVADGEALDGVKPNSNSDWGTLWTNKMQIISQEDFYQAGNGDWYITREESVEAQKKSIERYRNREAVNVSEELVLPEELAKKMLAFARRQPKCSRAKMANLYVTKQTVARRDGSVEKKYFVHTKNHSFKLG